MNILPNEGDRLSALASYGILDTPPDERFDRITRHAAWVFDVPISYVSLVDAARQWLKSRHGIDEQETPREESFCTHTITSGEVLVVEDARQDARFSHLPLVTGGPGVRFYAGAPLVTADGRYIGALCLLDTRPRAFSDEERAVLRNLADIVQDQLETVRREREAFENTRRVERLESRFNHMIQNGAEVITLLEADGTVRYQSPSITRIFGYTPEELVDRNVFELIHPADVDAVREAVARLIATGESVGVTFRFRTPGGAWKWTESSATNLLEDPAVRGLVINSRDITERKRQQARQVAEQRILERIACRAPLPEVLDAVCRLVEEQVEGARCTILLVEGTQFRLGAAPGLPASLRGALDGVPFGPTVGTCGAAASRQEAVITADIETDRNWASFRRVALEHGLRACFSTPILSQSGDTLGTFAIYYAEPRVPTEAHHLLAWTATFLARIALENARAEQALRESEEGFRALAETSNQIVWRVDGKGNSRVVDRLWSGYTGQDREQAGGGGWADMIHPEDRKWLATLWDDQRARARSSAAEFRLLSREGEYRWVSARTVPVFDDEGRLREFIGAATDIHDRRMAEEALRQSEMRAQRLAAVADRTTNAVIISDENNQIEWVNGGFVRLYGFTPEEAVGRWPGDLLSGPETDAGLQNRIQQMLARHESVAVEIANYHKDGRRLWVTLDIQPLTTVDGEPDGFVAVATDITAQKEVEAALRESEGRYRALSGLVSTYAFSYRIDRRGDATLEWITDSVEAVMGFKPEALIGNPWGAYLEGESKVQADEQLRSLLDGQSITYELQLPSKSGEHRWYRIVIVPEWDEAQARVARIYGAGQDITNQKQYEEELIRAREQAVEMSRLKDTFLANMSHEIRTPLTSIIGFSGVLADEIEGEARELAQLIRKSGERLMDTLNSVMDLAQLESGTLELQPSSLEVTALVQETVALFRREAHEKGLLLACSVPPAPLWAELDRGAVLRILNNLVSNAIKFTPTGHVTVSAGGSGSQIWLRVSDTGVGISPAFMPYLFDEFKQESSGLSRDYEGTGLGLTITKRIVGIMGGAIEVESEPGRGSMFTVHLPVAVGSTRAEVAVAASPSAASGSAERRPRVLVVEDNPQARRLFQHILGGRYRVTLVGTYDEAMACADSRFDLVVLDIHLEGEQSGVDLLHAFRRQPHLAAVPMVACTAYALPNDRERFLEIGFDAHLEKPFTRTTLFEAIEVLLDEAS